MFLLNKFYIPKWLLAAFTILVVVLVVLIYYFFTQGNSSQGSVVNSTSNNPSRFSNEVEQKYIDAVEKVKPPSQIEVNSYKVLDFADGKQLLSIPKELVTREPFATAYNKAALPKSLLRNKLLFIYNPSLDEVIFTTINLVNLNTVLVENKEYWVFSVAEIDGSERVYYSLPNFGRQRVVKELQAYPITEFKKLNSTNLQITVNTAQRGERLIKYNIDFTNIQFTTSTVDAEFTDKPPVVTVIK